MRIPLTHSWPASPSRIAAWPGSLPANWPGDTARAVTAFEDCLKATTDPDLRAGAKARLEQMRAAASAYSGDK